MNMEKHVLLFPFPAQGHINPVLQFAKRLVSKGLKTTLVTTVYTSKSIHFEDCKVGLEIVSDGFNETGPYGASDGRAYLDSFKREGSRTLADIIRKYNYGDDSSRVPISCIVGDAILPWSFDVGKEFGLVTAAFFTMTCSVSYIFYQIKQGKLSVPVEESTISIPGLPSLALHDLPSCIVVLEETSVTSLDMLLDQFSNLEKADWILFNTFDALEAKVLKLMRKLWRVGTIGTTTPSMYLDKRVEGDFENSLNMFKPTATTYIKWLNTKEAGSVLYISFGSYAELQAEQMEELISGIKKSNKDFMWVVRETEHSKLPNGFAEEMLEKGLIVSWCSQLEVLAHESIGCFLTHCGWNSTMEALSLGVPMVAMPQIWDQFTNAKLVEDVWKTGVRAKKDGEGIVRSTELELCITQVMEGESGEAIKRSATRWREFAKDAVDVGGSSDLNIEEFVESIDLL